VRAARARFPDRPRPAVALRLLTLGLYLLQPLARLTGRLRAGLAPWRPVRGAALAPPRVWTAHVWREAGQEPAAWLRAIAGRLEAAGAAGRAGGAFDAWDLDVRGGALGGARLLLALEEHGAGRQLARVRAWPAARVGALAAAGPAILALLAALDGAPVAGLILGIMALALAGRTLYECAAALGQVRAAVQGLDAAPPAGPP
jgi:O-antigen biosynthesis protein